MMHKTAIALLLSVLLPSCLGGLPNSKEEVQEMSEEKRIEYYTSNANYHYQNDALGRAQAQAVKVLELDPWHKPMRRMVGWIRLRKGSNADLLIAQDFFEDLRRGDDENQSTILGLGTTLERLGVAYEQASKRVQQGLQVENDGLDLEQSAAKLDRKAQGLWKESIELYDMCLVNEEGSLPAINGLQRVYALMGQYETSLIHSAKLLDISERERLFYRTRLTRGELSESEEVLFRENERIAEDLQTQTHLFAASVLHELGRDPEAMEHLDKVLEVFPDMAQAYSRRAQLRASQGNYPGAIADLDSYLGLSDEAHDHPDVVYAFDLRSDYSRELAKSNP